MKLSIHTSNAKIDKVLEEIQLNNLEKHIDERYITLRTLVDTQLGLGLTRGLDEVFGEYILKIFRGEVTCSEIEVCKDLDEFQKYVCLRLCIKYVRFPEKSILELYGKLKNSLRSTCRDLICYTYRIHKFEDAYRELLRKYAECITGKCDVNDVLVLAWSLARFGLTQHSINLILKYISDAKQSDLTLLLGYIVNGLLKIEVFQDSLILDCDAVIEIFNWMYLNNVRLFNKYNLNLVIINNLGKSIMLTSMRSITSSGVYYIDNFVELRKHELNGFKDNVKQVVFIACNDEEVKVVEKLKLSSCIIRSRYFEKLIRDEEEIENYVVPPSDYLFVFFT